MVSQKIEEYSKKEKDILNVRKNLETQIELANKKQEELDKYHQKQMAQLEAISALSAEEAKAQLIEGLKDEAKAEAVVMIQDVIEEIDDILQ
ncbi:MAG: DUF3552 domain-containing protein, partial [Candidatus Moranbacteria bacterium]|nr:DUF3552 domain-containing protein [Candidatus Moranbacteria bacterium]